MKIPLKRKFSTLLTVAIAVTALFAFVSQNTDILKEPLNSRPSIQNGECMVHFIDVGQGDSAVISADNTNILIDAGENNRGDDVLLCLNRLGIKKLDYVIGTHAHSDHIGGLDTVLNKIDVENIILYDLPENMIPTTKTYTDLLEAIVENDVELISAKAGESINVGKGKLSILAPVSNDYNDLNDFSIVTKFQYGETSFLFTGDAEFMAEKDLLKNGIDVSANVLKLGHHGSSTSTTKEFLKAVDPDYAIIEVGINNKYGHPMAETLSRLASRGVKIYRTDINGCITAVSDGKNISFSTLKE